MPEFKSATEIYRLDFHGSWPTAVAFINGNRVAAGDRNGRILIWSLNNEPPAADDNKPPTVAPEILLEGHTNAISHLKYVAASKELLSSSLDGTIRRWKFDKTPGEKTKTVVAAKSSNRNAPPPEPIELLRQTERTTLVKGKGWINAFNISGDQKRAIVGDDRGEVVVLNLADGAVVAKWQGHHENWIASAALSSDGALAFVSEYGGTRGSFDRPPPQVKLFDAATGEEKLDFLKVKFPDVKDRGNGYSYGTLTGKFLGRGLVCCDFSHDNEIIAAGMGGETSGAKVHLFSSKSGEVVRTISGHASGVTDVKFTADSKHLLSTGRDTIIRVCQTSDGKEVTSIGESRGGQFKDWLAAIELSPDQKQVAAADIAGFVRVWRIG